VHEDPNTGIMKILLMNGKQPKSATDFLILWNMRLLSQALIQSGKSLREEPEALSFTQRVATQA
jgi:hypothetical protein